MEAEFEGTEVVKWLRKLSAPEAARALIGCYIYDESSPDTEDCIVSVDPRVPLINCQRQGELRPAQLSKAYVIDRSVGLLLKKEIDGQKSDAQREFEKARAYLSAHKINAAALNGDAAVTLRQALEQVLLGVPLGRTLRFEVFTVLNHYSLHGIGLGLAKKAVQIAFEQGRFDPHLYIQLASFARECGALTTALTATTVLWKHPPSTQIDTDVRRILNSQRAAILMDLFEKDGAPERLVEAGRCLNLASALGGSELLGAMRLRLSKLLASAQHTSASRDSTE